MRTLAFDGRTGAAGDMLLGALVAAGADPDALAPVEEALGVEYAVDTVVDCGVTATAVDVRLPTGGDGHGHQDDGGDDRPVGPADDEHASAEGHGPHRSYPEVVRVVEAMDLPDGVESDARSVFELLGAAEARVHGTELAETRFHEVGADDAIADVVGVALLVADLDVERVVTTAVSAGGGEVETSHGTYPVPAPAVAYIAERADWALRGGPAETELLTPTGAALLAHFADGVESLPPLDVDRAGYGAGRRDLPGRPNVLRALVGTAERRLVREDVRVLETNLDDATPEVLGGLQDSLVEAGALDVAVSPLTMKKSRPGHLVKVVVAPGDVERVARRLAAETGTLGVRETGVRHRFVAERSVESVEIEVAGETHEVAVKVATDAAGELLDASAEYDEAAAVARETDVPVREVIRLAEAAYRA